MGRTHAERPNGVAQQGTPTAEEVMKSRHHVCIEVVAQPYQDEGGQNEAKHDEQGIHDEKDVARGGMAGAAVYPATAAAGMCATTHPRSMAMTM